MFGGQYGVRIWRRSGSWAEGRERERVREWEEAREGAREGVNVGRESDETERE